MFLLNSLLYLIISFSQQFDTGDSILFYKGYKEFMNGDWEDAENILLQHYDLYPLSVYRPRVLFFLGEINFNREQYDQARECWSNLRKLYPESEYYIRATLRLGDAYFRQKRYHSALKMYKEVKTLSTAESILQETDLKIHEVLYYLGEYKSLIDALYHFIDTNSDTTRSGGIIAKTMMRALRIHLEKKEYYSALTLLDRLQSTYPDSPVITEALFERANVYKLLDDVQGYKKTLSIFVAKRDTGNFYTYAVIELATLYGKEQRYDSSLYYWSLLKSSDKFKGKALMEIARVYYMIGQKDEATIVIQSLINEFSESRLLFDAYMLWMKILKEQRDFQQAIGVLKEMLDKVGSNPEIFLELGKIYFETKDYSSARKSFLMASESFKDQRDESARALILAGDAAGAMGDKKTARQDYLNARLIAQSEEIKNLAMKKMSQLD